MFLGFLLDVLKKSSQFWVIQAVTNIFYLPVVEGHQEPSTGVTEIHRAPKRSQRIGFVLPGSYCFIFKMKEFMISGWHLFPYISLYSLYIYIIYTNYQGQLVTASFFLFEVPQTRRPLHATGKSTYGPSINWCQKVVTWQSCWWPYWDGENVTLSKTYLVGGWVSTHLKKHMRKSNWIMFIHFP